MTEKKTKDQLLQELFALRKQVARLQKTADEQKHAHVTFEEGDEIFQHAVENSNDGVIILRGDTRLYCNKKYLEILGYKSLEEITDVPIYSSIHPDDRKMVVDHARMRQRREKVPVRYECRMIKKDGSTIHVEISASSIMYKGEPASLGFIRDVTESKAVEEKFRALKELESSIVGTDPHAIIALEERTIIFANDAVERIFGWKPKELIGKNTRVFYRSDEEYEEIGRRFYPVLEKKRFHREEFSCRRKDGTDIVCMVSTARIGKSLKGKKIVAIYEDITEFKEAEQALAEKAEEINRFFDLALDLLCIADTDGFFRRLSLQWERTLGYSLKELEGHRFLDFIHPDDLENTLAAVKDLSKKKKVLDFVNRYRCKDGSYRWIEWRSLPFGNLIYAAARDITDRKQTEEALRDSETKYRALIETTGTGYVILDSDGCVLDANNEYAGLAGCQKVDEVMGRYVTEWTARHDIEKNAQAVKRCFEEGFIRNLEIDYVDKTGRITPVEINATVITTETEPQIVSICRNITDRKRAEDTLRESEKQYRTVFENAIEGIMQTTPAGRYLNINPAMAKMFGYNTPEEMLTIIHDIATQVYVHPEDRTRYKTILEEQGRIENFESERYRKDGSKFWVSTNSRAVRAPDGSVLCYEGTVVDITQRKTSEETLRQERERFKTLSENAPFGLALIDKNGNFTYVNSRFVEIFGYNQAEIPNGKVWFRKVYPDDTYRHAVIAAWLEDLEKYGIGEKRPRIFTVLCKDGTQKIINFRPVALPNGETVMSCEDITQPMRMNEELRASHQRLLDIIEFLPDATFVIDREKKVIAWNKAIEQMTGIKKEEILGKGDYSYAIPFYGQQRPILIDLINAPDEEFSKQYRFVRQTGSTLYAEGFVPAVYDGKGAYFLAIAAPLFDSLGNIIGAIESVRDVTERVKAEETRETLQTQILQLQKMEAIGTLAGGIAHDFNNLLMGILGYTSLMLMDTDAGHPHYEKLKTIEHQVQSGADLTRQLLGFARGGKYEVKLTDLNNLIARTSDMFGRTKRELNIHRKLQGGLYAVEVDRGQIEQVLLNLYVNAWHAMPTGGELYLETQNVILEENNASSYRVKPGRHVKISITDTGIGMDEVTQQRIFEPFFTTKEMGRGTGLGLASAYGIIKNHSGSIHVFSDKGKGTTFTIYLPASEKILVEEKVVPGKIIHGAETILIVDDQETVTDVGKEMLETLGYKVFVAQGGREAIEIYKKRREEINLVLLDMIMPTMNGGETYDRLKEINPGVKVILSSGYSIDGQATSILERGCKGFIQKPFNMNELSKKIREALET